MRGLWRFGIIALALVATAVLTLTAVVANADWQTERDQSALQPFYDEPGPIDAAPGTLLRVEPLGVDVSGGTALRILYATERPWGEPAISGGMAFIPDSPAPAGGRPVVAWAHGTVGMAPQCAPSRSTNPTGQLDDWLEQMLARGWIVVATDYAGLGTPGPELYLVGEAEARDVVNSVRAAAQVPDALAAPRYAVYGHSQGGHSALWTGHLGPGLAPELDLLGVVAAAPAAQLVDIVSAQWDTAAGWAIGPEVAASWPVVDTDLDLDEVLSDAGRENSTRLADECIVPAALEGLLRDDLGQRFFSRDPVDVATWRSMAERETPPPLPKSMPALLAQGTADDVVLAWPNARLQESWCAAGSTLAALWLGGVNHQQAAAVAGPSAVDWIAGRFAGRPAPRTCTEPPAVSPRPPAPTGDPG